MGPGTTRSTASAALEAVLGSILSLTSQDEPLHITRFGTFRRVQRPARPACRLPGGMVQDVAPRPRLTFTPAASLVTPKLRHSSSRSPDRA